MDFSQMPLWGRYLGSYFSAKSYELSKVRQLSDLGLKPSNTFKNYALLLSHSKKCALTHHFT